MTPLAESIERGRNAHPASLPARVVIVGGGVAGLETLMALRAIAGEQVDITLLAPERKFVNHAMSAAQPFRSRRVRGVGLETVAADMGARLHRGVLDYVDDRHRRVVTRERAVLPYDMLVLAMGARAHREWRSPEVLTYHDGHDGPHFRLLLHHLETGRSRKVAFVRPAGPSWPLPLYDLALMTAAHCAAHGNPVELSFITPEEHPLGVFGRRVSDEVTRLLDDAGIALHAGTYAAPGRRAHLDLTPGGSAARVDRVVTQPRLVGPLVRGIPCDRDRFIDVDHHGRVRGLAGVFAAGDATSFPVKDGGLAAQQGVAVAEAIAASVGIEIDPQPFRPILRGVLLTGAAPRYLSADISGRAGDVSSITERSQWWPPLKLTSRYLGAYLARQRGDASDVMPGATLRGEPGRHASREHSRRAAARSPSPSSSL